VDTFTLRFRAALTREAMVNRLCLVDDDVAKSGDAALPVQMGLAGIEPATSRSGGARSIP
jgi:hypothetical protein